MNRADARVIVLCLLGAGLAAPLPARAGSVALRIRAANPVERPQAVNVRADMPRGIGTNDIIDLDGLQLGYDVHNDLYYVHGKVELGPKELRVFNVRMRDIWEIHDAELSELETHAAELAAKLADTEYEETAEKLKKEIAAAVKAIRSSQSENAVQAGVSVKQHIKAHEANLALLARLKDGIGHMENLVLDKGRDPGRLMGTVEGTPEPVRAVEPAPSEYRTLLFRITYSNTSPSSVQQINLRRPLPREIGAEDVVDSGGLEVETDRRTGICYLCKTNGEVAPLSAAVFQTKIRDKWSINGLRIPALQEKATNIAARISARPGFEGVRRDIDRLMADLEAIAAEKGPTILNEDYVAFYRSQRNRLDAIERKLNRIEMALRPVKITPDLGLGKVKPPEQKTTWLIIYIILGFLAAVSLLFFLRWYSRSKAEDFDRRG